MALGENMHGGSDVLRLSIELAAALRIIKKPSF